MTEKDVLRRKILLKKQGLELLKEELAELEANLALVQLKEYYERKIGSDAAPELSQKLACVDYLTTEHYRKGNNGI